MGISRLHIALLAIMSLFTGIIAPGTSTDTLSIAYPMTDARGFSYILLLFLILGFYTASIHAWKFFRYIGILIFGMIALLFFLTLSGQIVETKTGDITHGLSWGWIFFGVGILLLFRAFRGEKNETMTELRQTIDTLLGVIGSFTLACIASVIILISLSFTEKSYQQSIIENIYGTGGIDTLSGNIRITKGYKEISFLEYNRKENTLITSLHDENTPSTRLIREGQSIILTGTTQMAKAIKNTLYISTKEGIISTQSGMSDEILFIPESDAVLLHSGSDWNIRSMETSWTLDYSGSIRNPILSGDARTLAWMEKNGSGTSLFRMGKQEGEKYEKIYSVDLSHGGYDMMALVDMNGGLKIVKNGKDLYPLEAGYISGSFMSNGSHSIYTIQKENAKKIVYDGETLSQSYDEIREIFLEKNGGHFAYFAKPMGGIEYCLFTKFRGNICGLDGYMNPMMSADGSSIVYAGLKDGIWSIYRNTDIVVKNTNYANSDISGDYAFYDITNPRTYLFIKKDISTQKYSIIKNGKILPGMWDDFGTDVSFGYDNHIIMKLKDATGWRIAEL